ARHASLASQLHGGLQLALAEGQQSGAGRFTLVPAAYSSPYDSLVQARQLVVEQDVQLVTGLISRNEAASLAPLLRQQGVPMIVSDIGANVIDRPAERGPLIRSSLSYWQANRALGEWAIERGQRAVIITALYEAGYDALYAFRHGFTQAGGTVLATLVANSPAELGAQLVLAGASNPDLVYAAFSGSEALAFTQAYAAAPLARVPLIGAGFLVDEQLLPRHGALALGIASVMPWSRALDLAENRSFVTNFAAATGREADESAALGYDTGRLLVALAEAGGDLGDFAQLHATLEQATLVGPRGRLSFEPAFDEITSPLYLREVRRTAAGYQNTVIAQLGTSAAQHQHHAALRRELRSGWLYPYLVV
ncbi:MAG: ABC transporter substrate-binding protein, partial [Roseiflexaceae bacterium]|nr:ABC transporter substrate-binding protein [Roseiflexaceae bacterium]